ncbi:DNA phosphorothioation-associated protein 4 [Thalassotalea mangrovi]|uniref:DNA phosphorothioation-associated protein 4 n=1 Tax=Thalassotalea mangrovi TaxID=2572245 RepID=A0A4U1B785_9GAMM|nr:DNA phosphorothioation-associated protein 4 [Thalassotalea mangrovi]TKB46333.1 DNA phosphorothioation-associated protein 4 [Thalassotalea mangrovi]
MFKENIDKQAWKKLAVKRDRKNEPLVEKLCSNKDGSKPVFNYIKDLMVFAAMVGFSINKRFPLSGDTVSIILETYATDQKDAFIYLLALMTEKNGACLKDENLLSSIKIYEEYCNAGLEEIQLWLDENPGDHGGIDTLASKIFEQAIANERSQRMVDNPEELDVAF